MGWTMKALIGPECKHPHRIAVQWKERSRQEFAFFVCFSLRVCVYVCLHVFVWFCSDNTLGYHWRLRNGVFGLTGRWCHVAVTMPCNILYNGKSMNIFAVEFPASFFLPTGKGGCRGGVCGGHSLRLPEGPRGKRVSQTHAGALVMENTLTNTHPLRWGLWTQMTHTLRSIEGKEYILCSLYLSVCSKLGLGFV